MNTALLRLAARHPDGLRTWPAVAPATGEPLGRHGAALVPPIALVPRALNPRALHEDHPNSPLLSWPCPITGRLHSIALSRHRGRERQAMRREVLRLMREGTPKAQRERLRDATVQRPEALAA